MQRQVEDGLAARPQAAPSEAPETADRPKRSPPGQQHRQSARAMASGRGRRDRTPSPRCRLEEKPMNRRRRDPSRYLAPTNYTVFGRFRFVEDDDLEEEERGFR